MRILPLNGERPHDPLLPNRRDFLLKGGGGFGALALACLLDQDGALANTAKPSTASPYAPKPPHFAGKAKSVIFCFMDGGPSHIDLFDPKPELNKLAGQPLPKSFGRVDTAMGVGNAKLLGSPRKWKKHGQSGIEISDWYPHIATCADDLTVLRSVWQNGQNHVGSVCQMNTGSILPGRPSMGAWVTYGLGTENQNLPAYVVLCDDGTPPGGPQNWGTGFMPATYQGTLFRGGESPILNLKPLPELSVAQQRRKLDFIKALNDRHSESRSDDSALLARINSYELAFRMQSHAPPLVDFSNETEETKRLYGMDQKETHAVGRNCLLARRMVESGVRFVQVYCGSGSKWDAHKNIEANHSARCRESDLPIAGLIKDLKRRGLLDQTLVVWGGEFGRTPMSEAGDGRDHNPFGFSMFLAGGGVKPGQVIGQTDEIGLRAIEEKIHVSDLHANILHALGMRHRDLTFLFNGRDERATINGGRVLEQLFI